MVYNISYIWDSDAFSIQDTSTGEKSAPCYWTTVTKVTVFKRDLFTTDCICMAFEMTDGKKLETHEDTNNWREFIEELPKHLPGCKSPADWLWNVTTPAYAPNITEIFLRSSKQSRLKESSC